MLGVSRDAEPGRDQGRLADRHRQVRARAGPASSGCSTRPPTCCSTRSAARRTTPSLDAGADRTRREADDRAAASRRPIDQATAGGGAADEASGSRRVKAGHAERRLGRGKPASGRAVAAAVVLAVLTVVTVGLAVVFGAPGARRTRRSPTPRRGPGSSRESGQGVLAYDYRHLAADRKRAAPSTSPTSTEEVPGRTSSSSEAEGRVPGPAVQTQDRGDAGSARRRRRPCDAAANRGDLLIVEPGLKPRRPRLAARSDLPEPGVGRPWAAGGDQWLVDGLEARSPRRSRGPGAWPSR